MALPKLLREIFENDGAGPKFRADKIPVTQVTVDSALSSTSENPVQNKVINSALDGKLSLSGGTMTGDIQFNKQDLLIRGITNDTYIEICPGTTSNFDSKTGASLMMTGRDYTGNAIPKGSFYLTASNEANGHKSLSGSPDGSLTWCGASVWCGNAKWANRTNLTIGQSFTAPSRGFVYSRGNSTSAWGAIHTTVNGIHILGYTGKETDTGGTVYVNAGDTVIVSKDGAAEHISAIFVPIQ